MKRPEDKQAWMQIYCALIAGGWACPVTDDTHSDADLSADALADAADKYLAEAKARGMVPSLAAPSPRPKRS